MGAVDVDAAEAPIKAKSPTVSSALGFGYCSGCHFFFLIGHICINEERLLGGGNWSRCRMEVILPWT